MDGDWRVLPRRRLGGAERYRTRPRRWGSSATAWMSVIHGDGLASLQWRDTKGGVTREEQSNIVGPRRLRVERRGTYVPVSIAPPGEELHPAGGSARIELTGDFYVGLGVTSHDTGRIDLLSRRRIDRHERIVRAAAVVAPFARDVPGLAGDRESGACAERQHRRGRDDAGAHATGRS
jgi:hypothetical protein